MQACTCDFPIYEPRELCPNCGHFVDGDAALVHLFVVLIDLAARYPSFAPDYKAALVLVSSLF